MVDEPQSPGGESAEVALKRRELRLSFWTNTILIGVLGGIVTVIFALLDVHQKQKDLLQREKELTLNYGELEFKLVGDPLQQIISEPCGIQAANARKYLNVILNAGIVDTANAGKYEEVARVLTGTCAAESPPPPTARCDSIVHIASLGWRSGHKMNFCQARGFTGVWNRPNSSYSSGGYCYRGNDAVCRAAIESGS